MDAELSNCLDDPAIRGIVVNARDVTESRAVSRALRAVSRVNGIILHATEEKALLDGACAALVEFGDYSLAWVGRADHDDLRRIRRVAAAGDAEILDESTFSWGDNEFGRGVTGSAIRTHEPQVIDDFRTAPRIAPWLQAIDRHAIRSACSLPLDVEDETWALSLYARETRAFDEASVELFRQLADNVVYGVARLRDGARLAKKEAMLREAERLAHVGHWEWDLATDRFEFLADEVFAIHGTTPHRWGGTLEAFLDLVHPDDRADVARALDHARTTGSVEFDYRVVGQEGDVRFIQKRTEAAASEAGRPTRIVGTCLDITAQRLIELERRESAEFLSAITDNMAEGMLALDSSGRISFVNDAGGTILGWPSAELLGRPCHETIHAQYLDGSPYPVENCALAQVRVSGNAVRVDRDNFVRRDGSPVPVAYSASPLVVGDAWGTVVVFDDITAQIVEQERVGQELEKLTWIGRIRDALDEDRFVLYAQPIVDLATNTTVQHELLLRMVMPDGEVIAPAWFLAAAEEFGLISEIDRWVIREMARITGCSGQPVEFNLSAKSVMDPNMVKFIADALQSANASPQGVVCEITETVLLTDFDAGEAFVRSLNDIGCTVALDDFGVGYGGFSYLKRLPVATLKIDREFVGDVATEESSRNVVAAVVSLARAFSAKTVAEGAEDMETAEVLKQLGVDYVQGYALGYPAPIEEVFGACVAR